MFIYIIIYEVVCKFSFGLKFMNYRAASIFSLMILANALTICKYFMGDFSMFNNYWLGLLALIWLVLNLIYFGNNENHYKIMSHYKIKSMKVKTFYFVLTGLYIGLTVYMFLNLFVMVE